MGMVPVSVCWPYMDTVRPTAHLLPDRWDTPIPRPEQDGANSTR